MGCFAFLLLLQWQNKIHDSTANTLLQNLFSACSSLNRRLFSLLPHCPPQLIPARLVLGHLQLGPKRTCLSSTMNLFAFDCATASHWSYCQTCRGCPLLHWQEAGETSDRVQIHECAYPIVPG